MTTNAPEYVYVDVAIGGVDHRNNVKRVDQFRANGVADVFVTHQRATQDLADYIREIRNSKGKPSVKGFPGSTWAPDLHMDFDAGEDPAVALEWLRRVAHRLDGWGMDLRAIRFFFSGSKGFTSRSPPRCSEGSSPGLTCISGSSALSS